MIIFISVSSPYGDQARVWGLGILDGFVPEEGHVTNSAVDYPGEIFYSTIGRIYTSVVLSSSSLWGKVIYLTILKEVLSNWTLWLIV